MTDQEKLLECKDAITAVFGALGFDHKKCLNWTRMMGYEHYQDSAHICLAPLGIGTPHQYWDMAFSWGRTQVSVSWYDELQRGHGEHVVIAVPDGSGGWNLCDPGVAEERGQ